MTVRDSTTALAQLAIVLSVVQTVFRAIAVGAMVQGAVILVGSYVWDLSDTVTTVGIVVASIGSVSSIAAVVTAVRISQTVVELGKLDNDRG